MNDAEKKYPINAFESPTNVEALRNIGAIYITAIDVSVTILFLGAGLINYFIAVDEECHDIDV